MMSNKILLGLCVLFFAATVSAPYSIDWSQIDCTTYKYEGVLLPQAKIQLPPQAASLLNGETVNVIIDDAGRFRRFSAVIQDGIVSQIGCTERRDFTLEITAKSDAVEDIINSDAPINTFKAAERNKEIQFWPNSVTTVLKMFFFNIALAFQK